MGQRAQSYAGSLYPRSEGLLFLNRNNDDGFSKGWPQLLRQDSRR